jgi:hypothetical chaperone protein
LVHQASSRNSLAQARELWHDYTDRAQHERLMHVLTERLGHQLLAMVEQAKITCSESHRPSPINLAELNQSGALTKVNAELDPTILQQILLKPLRAITDCARQCVFNAGLLQPEVIYLTGGSSALRPLVDQLTNAFPEARMVHGDRFGGVANGLAWAAKSGAPG